MNSEIVISIISGLSVAVPSLIATLFSNYQNLKKNEENKKLTIYRLEELEKKVDKHNDILERIYRMEEDIKNLKEYVK